MSRLVIKGLAELNGQISVCGAKNAALPIVLACAVSNQPVVLENVPTELKDIGVVLEALQHVGCELEVGDGRIKVRSSKIKEMWLPMEIAGRFRSSLLFLGLLAGKCGHSRVTMPGGCDLGGRKFDLHLEGLRQLGAKVELSEDKIEVMRRERPAGPWEEVATAVVTEGTLVEQPKGKELEYRIVAVNKASDGEPSNTAMVVL